MRNAMEARNNNAQPTPQLQARGLQPTPQLQTRPLRLGTTHRATVSGASALSATSSAASGGATVTSVNSRKSTESYVLNSMYPTVNTADIPAISPQGGVPLVQIDLSRKSSPATVMAPSPAEMNAKQFYYARPAPSPHSATAMPPVNITK